MDLSNIVYFLIPVGLAATTIILLLGVYSLARGGAFAKANSNRLMRYRVMAQAITIALIVLFVILVGHGPSS